MLFKKIDFFSRKVDDEMAKNQKTRKNVKSKTKRSARRPPRAQPLTQEEIEDRRKKNNAAAKRYRNRKVDQVNDDVGVDDEVNEGDDAVDVAVQVDEQQNLDRERAVMQQDRDFLDREREQIQRDRAQLERDRDLLIRERETLSREREVYYHERENQFRLPQPQMSPFQNWIFLIVLTLIGVSPACFRK